MKKLIINADDLGADESRNAGIFEAVKSGIVTSVSILPNGPAFDDAIRRIKNLNSNKISCGVHINLSEGKPLMSNLNDLTGHDGLFHGKHSSIAIFSVNSKSSLEKAISMEVDAQVERLMNAGITISHLDGHHHIHVFPAVIKTAIRAASKYKIPWIRIPEEQQPSFFKSDIRDEIASEAYIFSKFASEARIHAKKAGIQSTEHFRGLYFKGKLSVPVAKALFQTLPDGLTEFMTHPGYKETKDRQGHFTKFSTVDREKELETLLHPEFSILLKKYGIMTTPFPET